MEWVQDKRYDLAIFDFVSEDSMHLCLRLKESYITPLKNGSVVMACFVTSYACLCLFEKLNKLHWVLYFDTDSIYYVKKLECGNFLGELTCELNEGKWIENFCLTGPKCHSFIMNFGKQVVYAKGFSLKGEGNKEIN